MVRPRIPMQYPPMPPVRESPSTFAERVDAWISFAGGFHDAGKLNPKHRYVRRVCSYCRMNHTKLDSDGSCPSCGANEKNL